MRSESALKEAEDSDRCIIIEGTIRTCSRTESGARYTANELVICEDGQSTWQAGNENGTAQQMIQAVDKTCSADNTGSEQNNKTVSAAVVMEQEKKETVTLPKSHAASFTLTREEAVPKIGDRVRLLGELQLFEPAGNPGQFDARSYYHRKNVVCQLKKPRILWKKSGNGGILRALQRLRGALDDSCLSILEEKDARTLAALVFGEKSWMDSDVKTQYQEGGIAHIASISGVKTLKFDIPLVPETRINWAFVPLHIAIIYILKLCLDEEIIPRCRFPCSRGYLTNYINWQKKQ